MADLSITNIVNVNINEPQTGISEYKVNNLAIFTKETPIATLSDGYGIYKDSISVAEDWGTTSEAYLQAKAIFAQSPNIKSGDGDLIIIQVQESLSATAGKFETSNIYENIAAIKLIDDGEFTIAIDGAASANITGLDFTSATDLADIASVIDTALTGASASADSTNGSIVITSDTTGASSSIEITAYTGGSGTDISIATLFDFDNGTQTDGRAAGDETLEEAIVRTQSSVFYFGILAAWDITSEIVSLSTFMQTVRKLLFFSQNSTTALNPGGVFYTIKNSSLTHTRCLLYTISAQDARLMAAAYASKGMSTNFDASNATQTLNLKDLATINVDSGITQTIKNKCEELGVDIYASISGIPKVFSFGANRYFDSIWNELAFVGDLEVAGFNALAKVSSKVPQTESGMEILKGAYRNVCEQYVVNAFIAPGTWNSTDTFGDPQTLIDNISNFGFYIYSQPVNKQSQADREARKAPVVQIAYKEAGAIHSTIVNLYRNA